MAKKSTAVAKTDEAKLPDWMRDYAGEGQEDIGREDIAMPRLKLGQAMSPEVKDQKIANEGDLIHSITKEVLCEAGKSLQIIPIAYSKEYILWYDREGPHGGGIAARARKVIVDGERRYMWDKPNQVFEDKIGGRIPVKYETKKFIDEDGLGAWGSSIPGDPDSGPAAAEHHNYVVMLPEHQNTMIALSLSRTAAKKAREFNSLLKMGQVPTYARIYQLSTFIDRSDNNSFANYQFSGGYEIIQDENLFTQLRELHQTLKDKGVNVDYSDVEEGQGGSTQGKDEAF